MPFVYRWKIHSNLPEIQHPTWLFILCSACWRWLWAFVGGYLMILLKSAVLGSSPVSLSTLLCNLTGVSFVHCILFDTFSYIDLVGPMWSGFIALSWYMFCKPTSNLCLWHKPNHFVYATQQTKAIFTIYLYLLYNF